MDNKELTTSPSGIKTIQHVNFYEALKAVVAGSHITKAEWENENIYGYLTEQDTDGVLMLWKDDSKDYQWIVSKSDLIGTDWIIL